jgi:hypothetical protein
MAFAVCPTDVVKAPVEVVWALLTTPAGWGSFFDAEVLSVEPPGSAAPGQRVGVASGRWPARFRLLFEFTEVDAASGSLRLEINLPFGIINHEELVCTPLGPAECRVAYGCNFDFPLGLGGLVLRVLLSRSFAAGPADSLARLKWAAETMWRVRSSTGRDVEPNGGAEATNR